METIYSSERIGIERVIDWVGTSDDQVKHDLALIYLNQSIDFTQTSVRPAPISFDLTDFETGILTGWGSTTASSQEEEVLAKGVFKYWLHHPNLEHMKSVSVHVLVKKESNLEEKRRFWIEAEQNLLCQGAFGSPVHRIMDGRFFYLYTSRKKRFYT